MKYIDVYKQEFLNNFTASDLHKLETLKFKPSSKLKIDMDQINNCFHLNHEIYHTPTLILARQFANLILSNRNRYLLNQLPTETNSSTSIKWTTIEAFVQELLLPKKLVTMILDKTKPNNDDEMLQMIHQETDLPLDYINYCLYNLGMMSCIY